MTRLLISTAAAAILAAGPALADCTARMASFEARFGDRLHAPDGFDRPTGAAMSEMRKAAIGLDTAGRDGACMTVVGAMEDILERSGPGAPAGVLAPDPSELTLATAAWDDLDREALVGAPVFDYDGGRIGEVTGIVPGDAGQPTHLIVGHGGFWQVFGDEAAVPFARFRSDAERGRLYLPMTSAELDNAPAFDRTAGAWSEDENDSYYETVN